MTNPQLLSLLSKPHHGGFLTGGNMLVSHDDDDYEKDDDDGLPKNQVKRRISSHGRTANELPNAHVVAFLLIILTSGRLVPCCIQACVFFGKKVFLGFSCALLEVLLPNAHVVANCAPSCLLCSLDGAF